MKSLSRCLLLSLTVLQVFSAYTQIDIANLPLASRLNVLKTKHVTGKLASKYLSAVRGGTQSLFFIVDSSEHIDFVLFGENPSKMQGEVQAEKTVRGSVTPGHPVLLTVTNTSPVWLSLQESGNIFMRITNKNGEKKADVEVVSLVSDSVVLNFGKRYKALVEGVNTFRARVSVVKNPNQHMLKFVFTGLNPKAPGALTGFGLKGDTEPTPENKQFDLARFDTDMVGFVMSQQNPLYCNVGTCTYSLAIKPSTYKYLDIYLAEYKEMESLRPGLRTIGEVEQNSPDSSIYTLPTIKDQKTTVFTLYPVLGLIDFRVNPGLLPKEDSQFYYKTQASSYTRRIFLSERDIQMMGVTNALTYAKVKCLGPCKYIIKAEIVGDEVLDINPGFLEVADMDGGEVRQHLLAPHHFDGEPTVRNYRVKLVVMAGEADLHMKLCMKGEKCKIIANDIKGNNTSVDFVSNRAKTSSKEIQYQLSCAATAPSFKTPDVHFSTSCGVMIGVEAFSKIPGSKIFYQLSVEEVSAENILSLGHFEYLRMPHTDQRNYVIYANAQQSKGSGISIILESRLGKFTYSVCQDDKSNCPHQGEVNAEEHGALSGYRRFYFDFPLSAVPRPTPLKYIISLKSSGEGPCVLTLGSTLESGNALTTLARDLPAGLMVAEEITNKTRGQVYTVRPSTDAMEVRINFVPVRGDFIVAVRNDDKVPTIDSAMWTSINENIAISKEDPNFQIGATYFVAVYPKIETTEAESSIFMYRIGWSNGDKHTQLDQGVPHFGIMGDEKECFIAELLPNWKEVMIMKGGHDSLEVFMTFGSDEHHTPSGEHHDVKIPSSDSGYIFKMDDIKSKCEKTFSKKLPCNAYLCVFGQKNVKYSLTLSADYMPITLPKSKTIHGPAPIGKRELHFIFHPARSQACDIEEFTLGSAIRLGGNLVEETEPHTYPNMGEYAASTVPANIIHVTREMIANYTRPLILITLTRGIPTFYNLGPTLTSDFYFHASFGLEAGFDMKELSREHPRTLSLEPHEWRYYFFYNHEPLSTLYFSMNSLNQGDGDIFIIRGKENRPTEYNHLARSSGFRSTYIEVDINLAKQRGYEDLTGFYVVGIRANSMLECSIYWKYSSSKLIQISLNDPRKIQIPAGQNITMSYFQFYKDDIELILDTSMQKLKVFYGVQDPSVAHKASQPDILPTESKNILKWEIGILDGIRILPVSKETPGYCNFCYHFFTLQNMNMLEPIAVDVKVNLRSSGGFYEKIFAGSQVFGAGVNQEFKKYYLSASMNDFNNNPYGLGLEVNMLHGVARVVIQRSTFDESGGVPEQIVRAGYTKLSLEQLAQGSIINGILRPASYLNGVVTVTCLEFCQYRMQIVHPEIMTHLKTNVPKEAFSAEGNQLDTFLLEVSGKEPRLEVSLTVEEVTTGNIGVTDEQIKGVLSVYHVKEKEDINSKAETALTPISSHPDGRNGRFIVEYTPEKGFLIVKVKGIPGMGFKYRIEVSTEWVSTILPGRLIVGKLGDNTTNHTYEMLHDEPGSIFARLYRCYGDVALEAKDSGPNTEFHHAYIDLLRYTKIWDSTNYHTPVNIRVSKATLVGTDRGFGYIDHQKNVSVYGLEVFDSRVWGRIPFDRIKPFDSDMYIDLKSDPPSVHFRPVMFPSEGDYANLNYKIRYYLALSKDPETLHYYIQCGSTYLASILKPEYNASEVVKIIPLPVNPKLEFESSSSKPYHTAEMNITSGEKYFMSIYAQIELFPIASMPYLYTSNSMRIIYPVVDFEYRSYFYPIELMASTLGLLGLALAVCCVLNAQFFSKMRNKIKHRFSMVGGGAANANPSLNPLEDSIFGSTPDLDTDLEQYFMKIKMSYEREEKEKERERRQKRNSAGKINASNDSMDADSSLGGEYMPVQAEADPEDESALETGGALNETTVDNAANRTVNEEVEMSTVERGDGDKKERRGSKNNESELI